MMSEINGLRFPPRKSFRAGPRLENRRAFSGTFLSLP
jgi:hypothetical protein